ncbi:MAG TPA: ribosome biogenesis GTPase Der [Actinobacteria bacterium]|nr:GTPase Der [bacterium BMS3Bbin01]HDH25165.1 ribosome biogenesis GTPase Der [Actinomycetota bacterium]
MSRMPVVAVVGRPNVGKSSLVNRILGRRMAVVQEEPGVTRDRREFRAEWAGREFLLVDTGGWELNPSEELVAAISAQAEAALRAADVVLLVLDATAGISADDAQVASLLRGAPNDVIVVANKVDGPRQDVDTADLWQLGLGEPMPISALHGRGVGDLLDRVVAGLPKDVAKGNEDVQTLAIIGRPNVGKSTLLNRLVGEERVLVSPVPGTTRDPIDAMVELGEQRFRVVDTAGIRRTPKVKDPADFYSVLRAKGALAEADVALLLIDTVQGVAQQDQRIAQAAAESGAALIVLLNKWDAADLEQREMVTRDVADRLQFVGWAPLLRVSALTGARLHRLTPAIDRVLESREFRIPTGTLNRLIRGWQASHPPPVRKGRRPRILYAVQAGTSPPTIILFVSGYEPGDDYLRYLENRLRDEFGFEGTPIKMFARRRKGRSG